MFKKLKTLLLGNSEEPPKRTEIKNKITWFSGFNPFLPNIGDIYVEYDWCHIFSWVEKRDNINFYVWNGDVWCLVATMSKTPSNLITNEGLLPSLNDYVVTFQNTPYTTRISDIIKEKWPNRKLIYRDVKNC